MTKHVRKQIRDRITEALINLPTTEDRVFSGRVYPLQSQKTPGLLIYTLREDSAREDSPTDSMRDLGVIVEGVRFIDNDLEDELDNIALQVEKAVDALGTMDGLVKIYAGIQSTEVKFTGEDTKKPCGAITMEFLYTYRTRSGAPETAI